MNFNKLEGHTNEHTSLLNRIRRFAREYYVAAAILGCIGPSFSSCNNNDNNLDISEFQPTVTITPEGGRIDITGGNKVIYMEGNTLKIGDKIVAQRDKQCGIWIEYEADSTVVKKENLNGQPLKKTGKIYIYLTPILEISSIPKEIMEDEKKKGTNNYEQKLEEFMDKISVKKSLILYATQEPLSSETKTLSTKGEFTEPMPNQVNAKEVFPNLNNRISDNDMALIEQAGVAEGHQMIQSMLNNGTTNLSPEEYKKHIESVNIVLTNEDNLDNVVFRRVIPNAKINIIKDDKNNSWTSKIIKQAHSHPEEIIIIYYPTNKDENIEFNYEKEINDLSNLDNVLLIEGTYSCTEIAIIGMAAQLAPNIKNAKDLEILINSSALHVDENTNGNIQKSIPIPNIGLIIRKTLTHKNLPDSTNVSNDETKNKIKIGEQ